MGKEFAGNTREEQEHAVSWLELMRLGRAVISYLLLFLGCQYVLLNDGDYLPYPLLHALHIFNDGGVGDGCSSQAFLATLKRPRGL